MTKKNDTPKTTVADEGVSHSIDDHMFGDFYSHDHDGDADHDHDDIDPGPLEDNPIWQRDNVSLTSVGIDIGSAGTQVIFSTIHLQRIGDSHTSSYVIVDRQTAYQSPVSFTPYSSETMIDAEALGKIIDDAYEDAAIRPADIDTGVVILTGEALRRENAELIGTIIAEKGGDFVTAAAGNHMEAMLAAYGSGAARKSHDDKCRILNVDIGGGTTKLALVEKGKVLWTAALHIGGRLVVAQNGVLTRVDPAGAHHAAIAGAANKVGSKISVGQMKDVAVSMSRFLVSALTSQPMPEDVQKLFLTEIPTDFSNIDGIMFSGGVSEYVYQRETRDFGDLGIHLGHEIRRRANENAFGVPLLDAVACIRATALGASEYSVQLSGQTSTITKPGKVLPRRSMQVLKPDIDLQEKPDAKAIADSILQHYIAFDLDPEEAEVALAFEYTLPPEYKYIRALADGVVLALSGYIKAGGNLYLMISGDIAQTLGGILREEIKLENELVILDGLALRDFDYIDLGKIRLPSFTVPVTVKSILFQEEKQNATRKEKIHFAGEEARDAAKAGPSHDHGQSHFHPHPVSTGDRHHAVGQDDGNNE